MQCGLLFLGLLQWRTQSYGQRSSLVGCHWRHVRARLLDLFSMTVVFHTRDVV